MIAPSMTRQPTRQDLEKLEAEILRFLEEHGESTSIDIVAKDAAQRANRLVVESAVRRLIESGKLVLTRNYELKIAS